MVEIVVGLIFIIISVEFKKIVNYYKKDYLFENRKFYYPISFVLNFIGTTLLFGNYGFLMSLMTLFTMITFDKYEKFIH